ncbi:MAG: hypothetical protein HYU56_01570 [Candidatus Aenigmarchaeota archaeon]|nr:hypothetical protein [Candidatus Aenigmarchaeota archaeon]
MKILYIIIAVCLTVLFSVSYADSGDSANYRLIVDTSAYADSGNSTSYKAFIESALSADSSSSSLYRLVLGILEPPPLLRPSNATSARLDFVDQIHTGSQILSVIVSDNLGNLVSGAVVNGTIVGPGGSQTPINFTETAAGNYTNNFNLSDIGDYTIQVSIAKPGFADISSSKGVYAGFVKLASFTSDPQVFQGNSIAFSYSAVNMGTVNSTITPKLFVYNSQGALVFSKTGVAQELKANETATQVQVNIMTWSAGFTAAGQYNATGQILFTDPGGNEVLTPNKTVIFNILESTSTSASSGGGGGSGGASVPAPVQNITNLTQIPRPVAETLQFVTVPALVEIFQGERKAENIVLYNPTDNDISGIRASVDGISDWVSIPEPVFDAQQKGEKIVTMILDVPPTAVPGNYQARLRFFNGTALRELFFILRVYSRDQILQRNFIVIGNSFVDEIKNETHIRVNIKNKEQHLESATLAVRIDKNIASRADEVVFIGTSPRIIEEDPLVEYTFLDLKPFEERNVSYYVRNVIATMPFSYASAEQISIVTPSAVNVPEGRIPFDLILVDTAVIFVIVFCIILSKRKPGKYHYRYKRPSPLPRKKMNCHSEKTLFMPWR